VFARRVAGEPGHPDQPGLRRGVDDPPLPLRFHDRELGLQTRPDALHVDIDAPVPTLLGDAGHVDEVGQDAGVVVRELEAPVRLDRDVEHVLDRLRVRDVDLDERRLAASVVDQFHGLSPFSRRDVRDDDVRALRRELESRGPADSGARARDQRRLPRNSVHTSRRLSARRRKTLQVEAGRAAADISFRDPSPTAWESTPSPPFSSPARPARSAVTLRPRSPSRVHGRSLSVVSRLGAYEWALHLSSYSVPLVSNEKAPSCCRANIAASVGEFAIF